MSNTEKEMDYCVDMPLKIVSVLLYSPWKYKATFKLVGTYMSQVQSVLLRSGFGYPGLVKEPP